MPYKVPEEELKWRKKQYYDANPEQDPQSWPSWFLEQFGFDDPYANDSGSYDYRTKRAQEEMDSGNPDFNWMFPAIPDQWQLEEGGKRFIQGEEWDDRPWQEKTQAAILNGLSWPLIGFEKEAAGGVTSLLPGGGTWDEETKRAEEIEQRDAEYSPTITATDVLTTGAGLAGALGSYGGVSKAWSALAPKTVAGKVGKYAAMPAGSAAYFTAMDMGAGSGSVEDRINNVDPMTPVIGAAFPILGGAGSAISKAGGKAKEMFGKMFKTGGATVMNPGKLPKAPSAPAQAPFRPRPRKRPKPPKSDIPKGATPQTPISSVRDDIETAMQQSSKRRK